MTNYENQQNIEQLDTLSEELKEELDCCLSVAAKYDTKFAKQYIRDFTIYYPDPCSSKLPAGSFILTALPDYVEDILKVDDGSFDLKLMYELGKRVNKVAKAFRSVDFVDCDMFAYSFKNAANKFGGYKGIFDILKKNAASKYPTNDYVDLATFIAMKDGNE